MSDNLKLITLPAQGEMSTLKAGNGELSFTKEDIILIRESLCPDLTDEEFNLYIKVCLLRRLNPILREIYAIKRFNKSLNKYIVTHQTSIDGFRIIAERTGLCDYRETGLVEDASELTAWAKIGRKGWQDIIIKRARLSSYIQLDKYGNPSGCWKKMPDVMLEKCAEAAGLRQVFPESLAGLYIHEEMQHADNPLEVKALEKDLLPTTQTVIMQAPSAPSREIVKNCKDSEEISRKQACKAIVIEIGRYIQQGLVTAHDIHEVSGFSSIKDLYAQEALEELQSTLDKVKGLISEFEGNQKAMVG